jgi:hypothetical protein
MPWVLTWCEGDSGEPGNAPDFRRFETKDEAIAFVRENWEPVDDIIAALEADGEWSECRGAGYTFNITLACEVKSK